MSSCCNCADNPCTLDYSCHLPSTREWLIFIGNGITINLWSPTLIKPTEVKKNISQEMFAPPNFHIGLPSNFLFNTQRHRLSQLLVVSHAYLPSLYLYLFPSFPLLYSQLCSSSHQALSFISLGTLIFLLDSQSPFLL